MSVPASSSDWGILETPYMWFDLARRRGLTGVTLGDLTQLHSASKLTEKEFILMKVIWPARKTIQDFPEPHDKTLISKADGMLQEFDAFKAYRDHVRDNKREISAHREMGIFQLVRASQLEVMGSSLTPCGSENVVLRRSPRNLSHPVTSPGMTIASPEMSISSLPSAVTAAAEAEGQFYEKTKDEQIVNESLMSFLKALTINISGVRCHWTSARELFHSVQSGDTKMTARTDGYLQGIDISDVFSIVEVKPGIRNRRAHPEVLWQESAEMIAWVMHDAKESSRKFYTRR